MIIVKFFLMGFLFLATPLSFAGQMNLKVTKLTGEIQFGSQILKAGDQISRAGLIKVADDPKAQIDLLYPDGHKLRLKSGGQLVIEGEGKLFAKSLTLLKGQSFIHFLKKPDVKNYKFKTRTAVAGVRGTKFLLEDREGATYLCVCEGTVELSSENIKRSVAAGQDLWSRPGAALGEPKNSPDMSKQTNKEFESM